MMKHRLEKVISILIVLLILAGCKIVKILGSVSTEFS